MQNNGIALNPYQTGRVINAGFWEELNGRCFRGRPCDGEGSRAACE